jgi:hypothetical protein
MTRSGYKSRRFHVTMAIGTHDGGNNRMDARGRGDDRPEAPAACTEEFITCRTYEDVAAAIRNMVIRGAPAIGVAAAMGVALGVAHADGGDLDAQVERICETLARTRSHRSQPVLGDRPHAQALSIARRAGRWPRSATAWPRKRSRSGWRISPSTMPSDKHGADWCRMAKRCLRTATPARWPPRVMAPRWA